MTIKIKKTVRRKEKLAGYYFDMSKLIFATTVLANFDLVSGNINVHNITFGCTGLISTVLFAWFGNNIMKF